MKKNIFCAALVSCVAILGVGAATSLNTNSTSATAFRDEGHPDRADRTFRWITFSGKLVGTYVMKDMGWWDSANIDSVELPAGYRLANTDELYSHNIHDFDGAQGGDVYFNDTDIIHNVYVVSTKSSTAARMGTAHINYPAKYGIQIWTKEGTPVRYNATEARQTGHKKGDAKKLKGQTNWKVYNATYKAHGTTYYNLGGDQYIDANYVTFH